MGSLTVRNIDEAVKKRLRLRAAANGRSMEEEIRLLLAAGAADAPVARQSAKPAKTTGAEVAAAQFHRCRSEQGNPDRARPEVRQPLTASVPRD